MSLGYAFPAKTANHSYILRISSSRFSGTFYHHTLPSLSILLLLTMPENWIHGFATPWHIARVPSLIWSWIFPFLWSHLGQIVPILPCRGQEQSWQQKLPSELLEDLSPLFPLLLPGTQVTQQGQPLSIFHSVSSCSWSFPKTPM